MTKKRNGPNKVYSCCSLVPGCSVTPGNEANSCCSYSVPLYAIHVVSKDGIIMFTVQQQYEYILHVAPHRICTDCLVCIHSCVCRRCSWVQRVQITYLWQPDIARLCNCQLTVHKYLLFIESVFLGHGCVWGADLFRALYSQAVGRIWNDLWGLQWRSEGRM